MAKTKKKSKKKIRIELSRRSVFLWCVFLLFLLFWMFVLGIFVGKGLLRGALPEVKSPFKIFEKMFGEKDEYEYKKPDENPKLIFYDKLLNKRNEVKNNSLPPRKEEKSAEQEITLSRDETAGKPGGEGASEVRKTIERKIITEEVPDELFSVQIASLTDHDRAQKLVKELVDQGYDAYYYTATVKGKKTYRLMCGRFNSHIDALEYKAKLEKDTGYKGFVSRVDR